MKPKLYIPVGIIATFLIFLICSYIFNWYFFAGLLGRSAVYVSDISGLILLAIGLFLTRIVYFLIVAVAIALVGVFWDNYALSEHWADLGIVPNHLTAFFYYLFGFVIILSVIEIIRNMGRRKTNDQSN